MEKYVGIAIAIVLLIIGVFLGYAIGIPVIVALFPMIITQLVSLSTLGNFTFASLFASTGFMPILLSAMVLLLMLAIILIGVYAGVKYLQRK